MRGQHAFTALFAMLVLIMTVMVAIGIVQTIRSHYDALDEDLACGAQVLAHSIAVRKTGEAAAPTISCPTRRETIPADATAAEANGIVAKEMAGCWAVWGRGELQLFGEEEGLYCHVCSMIETPRPVTGLDDHLRSAEYEGVTYAEFLTGTERGTYFEEEDLPGQATALPAEEPIGVILYYAKGNEFYRDLHNAIAGNPAVGAASGYVAGYVVTGVVASPLGTSPISEVVRMAGGGAGAAAGALASLQDRLPNSYATVVVVRPLSATDIATLGCQYAPVANE